MTHHFPIARAIGFFLVGAVALALNGLLWPMYGWFTLAAGVLGLVGLYLGIAAVLTRNKRPLQVNDHVLSFYKGRHEVTIERRRIERVFYNTSGLDKRVTVETSDGKQIDIPAAYGLAPLAKKLSSHLGLQA